MIRNKKKGFMGINLSGLIGIIIFFIIFISLLFSIRGCKSVSSEASSSFNELVKNINDLDDSNQNMVSKNMRLIIDDGDAIILYSEGDSLKTKFEFTTISGDDKSFPETTTFNDVFKVTEGYKYGSADNFGVYPVSPQFYGFIKPKPDSCPDDKSCACYCRKAYVNTKSDVDAPYSRKDAYLLCEEEICIILNSNVVTTMAALRFFGSVYSDYVGDYEINILPDPTKIFWEGGFIFSRMQFDPKKIKTKAYKFDSMDNKIESVEPQDSLEYNWFYSGYISPYKLRIMDIQISKQNSFILGRMI